MTTKSMMYDNASYVTRQNDSQGEAGGAATTAYAKFVSFTAMLAFSAQLTVTVAGTATTNAFIIQRVSGTTTTVLRNIFAFRWETMMQGRSFSISAPRGSRFGKLTQWMSPRTKSIR